MISLSEAKKTLTDNCNIEVKGGNFTSGHMSYYAFKNPNWGSACNVVYVKIDTDTEGRFLLLSEFKKKFCSKSWSLSEAELILLKEDSYIITNLTKVELEFVQTAMFREYGIAKNYF